MLEEIRRTYKGKKVFLTGHTGFKGSWMLMSLQELGAEVTGYALTPEEPSLYNVINGDAFCKSIISDIRHEEKLEKAITDFQPDFIFHMAAQPLVRESYAHPVYTYETNVIGTANLLNAVRKLEKPCCLINITTDKVYENMEKDYAYQESDKLGGYDPYSASKACAEITTASFRYSFFNPEQYGQHQKSIATVRAGNVIGGGDWAKDRIIPDLARAFEKNEPLKVRNPKAIRPWQHVLEPVLGYLLLGSKMKSDPVKFSDSFNFGPEVGDNKSVEELIKIAIEAWGSGAYEVVKNDADLHEAGILKLDITKTKKTLSWKPLMNSTEAIRKTVEWYKNYKKDPVGFTRQQIGDYINRIK